MTLPPILLWIILISTTAVGAAWYARRSGRSDILIALFVTLVIASNILASKIVSFNLGIAEFFAPGAVLIFSVTFLLTDIVNERFGKDETLRMIGIGFVAQLLFVLMSYLVLIAPAAPFFANQAAFDLVLGVAPRMAFAGLVAYLLSETMDAYVFAWWRRKTGGKHLWLRSLVSTLPAMVVDSVVFVVLAFSGTAPVLPLVTGLVVVKWLVGIVDVPFMYLSRSILRVEHKG